MAQIIKNKKGYGIRFYVDDKRVYLGGFQNKAIAKKAMENYLEKHEKNKDVIDSTITITKYCEKWFDSYAITNLAPTTQKRYAHMIKNYIIPKLGDKKLLDLKPIEVQNFYSEITNNEKKYFG